MTEQNTDQGFRRFSDEEMSVILKQILPPDMYEKVEYLALRHPLMHRVSLQGFTIHVFFQEIAQHGRSLSSRIAGEKRRAKRATNS